MGTITARHQDSSERKREAAQAAHLLRLSDRITEKEALVLKTVISQGVTVHKDLANEFSNSVTTIKTQLRSLFTKTGTDNLSGLIAWGLLHRKQIGLSKIEVSPLDMERRRRAEKLSQRHKEVSLLVRDGLTNKDIGSELGISEFTVKVHVATIMCNLDFHDRNELALFVHAHPKLFKLKKVRKKPT